MINAESADKYYDYDISEEIRSIVPIEKYINFCENLINSMKTSDKVRENLDRKFRLILDRAYDEELKLALIGQFSSGKSTFINAIIGKRVLKSAWKATTSIPTYIRYGDRKHMIVNCKDGQKITAFENDTLELYSIMKVWGCKVENDDLVYLLQSVTSDVHSGKYVDSVEFFYPKEEIRSSLCLIDTPGVNPGADDTAGHRDITKQILKEKADAAIILFPATRVFTNDFGEFLQENASSIIHRCAFVITMMDLIDEDERDEIIEFVRKMLRTRFEIQEPQIFYCAAENALKDKFNEGEALYWISSFKEMKDRLIKFAIKERGLIIVEQLIDLLKNLLEEAKEELKLQQAILEEEQRNLRDNSIEKLDDVLGVLKDECSQKRLKDYDNYKKIIEDEDLKFEKNINNEIVSILNKSGFSTYKDAVSVDLPGKIREHHKSYNDSLQKSLKGMTKKGKEEMSLFKNEFEIFYTNLKALDSYDKKINVHIDLPQTDSISFEKFKDSMRKEDERDKKNAKVGAGGGAAVGFMIGGPLGALIGAGVGAFATLAYSGTKWDKFRDELERSVKADVSSYISLCRKNSKKALDTVDSNIKFAVEKMVDQHKQTYEATINGMILKHKQKMNGINNRRVEINLMSSEVDSVVDELELIRKNMKSKY